MNNRYTYAQKRIVLVKYISMVDNKLQRETDPGNRHALETELAVLREAIQNLHAAQAPTEPA